MCEGRSAEGAGNEEPENLGNEVEQGLLRFLPFPAHLRERIRRVIRRERVELDKVEEDRD